MVQDHWWIERDDRSAPLDLKADLESLELATGPQGLVVRFDMAATHSATVRPREVLEAIGLGDFESEGHYLTRTCVTLAGE
jgi:hypothetical protein